MIDGHALGPVLTTVAADLSSALQNLLPGQRVAGRVLEAVADGQFVIALGTARIVAQSAQPLAVGQRITVAVTQGPTGVELRLVPDVLASATTPEPDAVGDQRLAVAALVTAIVHGGVDRSTPAPSGRALLAALAAALPGGRPALSPADLPAVAHLLPIEPDADALVLAGRLQAAFENGGQLFEAHLRALLTENPGLTAQHALERLRDDARAFLGRATTTLAMSDASDAGAARAQLETTAAHILSQQARLALDWVANGIVTFELPVRLPSGDTQASITVQQDRDAGHDEDGQPAFRATFRIRSDELGPIDTRVAWLGGSLSATISVATVEARERLEPEMAELTRGLSSTFARVQTDLRVDAARTASGSPLPDVPMLPGGSLLNVRA